MAYGRRKTSRSRRGSGYSSRGRARRSVSRSRSGGRRSSARGSTVRLVIQTQAAPQVDASSILSGMTARQPRVARF